MTPEVTPHDVLSRVIDPEIGIDIVSLGLVYEVEETDEAVRVVMTLTSPSCPMGEMLRAEAEQALAEVFGAAHVDLVWSPPWGPERMSDEAKRQLGW